MKKLLLYTLSTVVLFLISTTSNGQAPNLGTAVDFAVFSTDGAVSNTGNTHITGHVGTNNGSSTGFGNINGTMHDNDGASAQAAADLLSAYNELNNATPDFFPAPLLGNGQTLTTGVYSVSSAATLNGELILDAQGNPSNVFIFQIDGPLSTNTNSSVTLINGAQACNVFWKVEGLVATSSATEMRGTVVANNAGINMTSGTTLEGRVLSTTGAVSLDGVSIHTPTGCGSPTLTGPSSPTLGEVDCYGIFSSDGNVINSGFTTVSGAIGTHNGITTGYNALLVSGNIHAEPDGSTEKAAGDLNTAYDYLNGLSHDIELMYPAQLGNDILLTPHTYLLSAATTLDNTIYLNARGNSDAVFVIKISGALEVLENSNIVLSDGADAENVYWIVNGAVDIRDQSVFNGNIIAQGAVNVYSGVDVMGRLLTGVGKIETNATNGDAEIPSDCETVVGGPTSVEDDKTAGIQKSVTIYPNPFRNSATIEIHDSSPMNTSELRIYNLAGVEVFSKIINNHSTTINTSNLPSGMYFYRVIGSDKTISTGKIISRQ